MSLEQHSHLEQWNIRKITTYGVGKAFLAWDRVKPVNRIPFLIQG
jgi:hypothetical protein